MITKIIIFALINLSLNSLSEKDFSIKAVYETIEPNENITLISSYCKITKLNIDGKFVDIISIQRDNYFHYFYIFDNKGNHTVFLSFDWPYCLFLSYMFYNNKN